MKIQLIKSQRKFLIYYLKVAPSTVFTTAVITEAVKTGMYESKHRKMYNDIRHLYLNDYNARK